MSTDDTIDALRDELQRLRIERVGMLTDLEELKAEVQDRDRGATIAGRRGGGAR